MRHTAQVYEHELKSLDARIAQMGGLCEQSLAKAMEALEKNDPALAEQVIHADRQIDQIERDIEEMCIQMIALRQPVAIDLRQIVTALRISSELERIGDLAKNIAKRTIAVAGESRRQPVIRGFKHIGTTALQQLKDVLDAYATRDAPKARAVRQADLTIDEIYNSLFRELMTYMIEDARNITLSTHILFGAKNIERIGDHVTNMAEMVYFMVEGEAMAEGRPKADTTAYMTPQEMDLHGDSDDS